MTLVSVGGAGVAVHLSVTCYLSRACQPAHQWLYLRLSTPLALSHGDTLLPNRPTTPFHCIEPSLNSKLQTL